MTIGPEKNTPALTCPSNAIFFNLYIFDANICFTVFMTCIIHTFLLYFLLFISLS